MLKFVWFILMSTSPFTLSALPRVIASWPVKRANLIRSSDNWKFLILSLSSLLLVCISGHWDHYTRPGKDILPSSVDLPRLEPWSVGIQRTHLSVADIGGPKRPRI